MRKIREFALDMACKYLLKPKSFRDIPTETKNIYCTSEDIKQILHTSNNVMQIKNGAQRIYFRECKPRTSIWQYVLNELDCYYTKIRPDLLKDKKHIETALSKKKNLKKFVNMGMTNDESSGAYNFCMGRGAHYIGLDGIPADVEERAKDFVQFAWGELFAYRLNKGLKLGCYQTYNAIRGIATYRIACLLGLGELIPKTEYAKIFIDGEFAFFGTVMDEAGGFSVEEMEENRRAELVSPELQRLLSNLNILDVLCLEKDHRPGNYNVTESDGKVDCLIAFDNDSPNSFGLGDISFETYLGCSPWVVNGKINRPYVDANTINRIFEITDGDLENAVHGLLNFYQRITIKSRLSKIKKVLSKIPEQKVLEKHMWSENTIKEELSGAYGKTYLTKFIEKRQMPYQPWLKSN